MAKKGNSQSATHDGVRKAGAALLLIVFLLLTWNTARSGLTSLLTTYAASSSQIAPANAAVGISPSNPDAHYVRATILSASDLPAAITDFEQAALARPDDYVLWLSLARARELNGDTAGAVVAARQAVPLAPDYAEPHYQLGNILLRAGRRDEAFRELRLAGVSNPTLMPGIIDLAWRVSGGNVEFVTRAIAPASSPGYQALGQYFRQRNQVGAAIAMYAAAGPAADNARISYLAELIGGKRFKDAANLAAVGGTSVTPGVMNDPGFEQESNLDEPGFGWRIGENPQGFRLSLDTTNPREGRSSLKVEFNGDSNPAAPVISEIILIDPAAHYQLRFAARSEGLVSGGLPLLAVIDADADRILKQSEQFPKATEGWRDYTIDFDSGPSASAIKVALQRQLCDKSPCPIFGRVWLDNFSLQKL
jgi:tetratricopeptide (TPR) repeat protein